MAAIEVGARAPRLDAALEDAEGRPHVVADALTRGPVVLGIYKSSCQASKTIMPFLQRLRDRYADAPLTVFGVSQDSPNITRSFARRYGLAFPILIEPEDYPISRAFQISSTPTIYLIRPDGTVGFTTMGFFKAPVNELGEAVATILGREPEPLVTEADAGTPMFVPG